jgi:hypothetical protein
MRADQSLNLQSQINKHVSRIRTAIQQLAPNDPLSDWFRYELHMLGGESLPADLHDAGAVLHGLRQLEHLLFEHHVRLRNPFEDSTVDSLVESQLTTRARLPADVVEMARDKRFSIDPKLLFHPTWDNARFDPVSPTAKVVGYLRGRDPRLRIAPELSMEEEGKQILANHCAIDESTLECMSGLFQSRHHAVNVAIAATGTKQILELAAGISPRGLQWARSMPGTIYVESDLPSLMIRKAKLLRNHILKSPELNVGHLHCCTVDVLDLSSWQKPFEAIDVESPFVIVSEGLLLYFTKAELSQFMQHMREFLKRYPMALWITDFVTRNDLQNLIEIHPGVAQAVRQTFALTGRSVVGENPLENEASISQLAVDYGLHVRSTVKLSDCSSRHSTPPFTDETCIEGGRKIWTLTASTSND